MERLETPIADLFVLKPTIFSDQRGYFFESYRTDVLEYMGIRADFVQDNQSMSQKGVIRGLHFQDPPFAQGKLIRVIVGSVLDVALDIRKDSTTYGQSYTVELSEENKLMMWIPPGFAHGFATLENNTVFCYKCTGYYDKASERTIMWNDVSLAIDWRVVDPVISQKDSMGIPFSEFASLF